MVAMTHSYKAVCLYKEFTLVVNASFLFFHILNLNYILKISVFDMVRLIHIQMQD